MAAGLNQQVRAAGSAGRCCRFAAGGWLGYGLLSGRGRLAGRSPSSSHSGVGTRAASVACTRAASVACSCALRRRDCGEWWGWFVWMRCRFLSALTGNHCLPSAGIRKQEAQQANTLLGTSPSHA